MYHGNKENKIPRSKVEPVKRLPTCPPSVKIRTGVGRCGLVQGNVVSRTTPLMISSTTTSKAIPSQANCPSAAPMKTSVKDARKALLAMSVRKKFLDAGLSPVATSEEHVATITLDDSGCSVKATSTPKQTTLKRKVSLNEETGDEINVVHAMPVSRCSRSSVSRDARPSTNQKTYSELMTEYGNMRSSRVVSKDTRRQQPSKSILVTPKKRKSPRCSHRVCFSPNSAKKTPLTCKTRQTTTRKSVLSPDHSFTDTSMNRSTAIHSMDCSMMGYDWIAGLLDNDASIGTQSEDFFEELQNFRRVNREDCVYPGKSTIESPDTSRLIYPTADGAVETRSLQPADCCSNAYMLNHRLRPIPIHGPNSECPICSTRVSSESEYKDSYIRVTVPRSTLISPYRIKAHRRSSYDPSESVALSEHCLAGWQSTKPSYIPAQPNIDLKSHLEAKPSSAPSLIRDRISTSRGQTDRLLNDSVAWRFEAQTLERDRKLRRKPHSTNFPC